MRIGWIGKPGGVGLDKGGDVGPGGSPLVDQGKGEREGCVVHHGGGESAKRREEARTEGYKKGGIIGNIMNIWMVGKRRGGVKSEDGLRARVLK